MQSIPSLRCRGDPEVIAEPEAEELVTERSAAGIADGVRHATRRYAARFGRDETTAGQIREVRRGLTECGRT